MADAAARREARRKRILENSQSRLEKITGRKEASNGDSAEITAPDSSDLLFSQHYIRNGSTPAASQDTILSNEEISSPFFNHSSEDLLESEEIEYVNSTQNVVKGKLEEFFKNKMNLVFLAFIVRLSYLFEMEFLFSNMIFIPLILYQLTNILASFGNSGPIGFLGAALLLSGINKNVIDRMTKYVWMVQSSVENFLIYFGTFVILHIILDFLGFDVKPIYYERI